MLPFKSIWLILSTIRQNGDTLLDLKKRILLFLIVCFSRGSVVTHCRCGGKYDTNLVANLLLSLTVIKN